MSAGGRRDKHNDAFILKSAVAESAPLSQLSHIQFGMFSWHEMARAAEINITNQGLYNWVTRVPTVHGVLDSRLGVSAKGERCGTCGQNSSDCPGHWGVIDLQLPVFHVGFFKEIIGVAQCVCKSCARVLLKRKERKRSLQRMRNPRVGSLERTKRRKVIVEACKKVRSCPWCGSYNGVVKRVPSAPTMRIIHDKYRAKGTPAELVDVLHSSMQRAADESADVRDNLGKANEDLTPLVLYQLFQNIPDEDLDLLYMSQTGRPENMILHKIMVPPVAIRPSVSTDGGSATNEDDLTVKLREIIEVNNAIVGAITQGTPASRLMMGWDILQNLVAEYIAGEAPGAAQPGAPKKAIRALCQRLKGKQGRFRGNLSGKRVNFSGRTVISPDPLLPIFEVGVPELVACVLTFPAKVTDANIEELRTLVRNGTQYPGANKVIRADGIVRSLQYGDKGRVADELRVGDTVLRHMKNGDFVLFNRQPSLHKMSIMAHQAHVFPHRTFRFNECVCAPYNADFDGDEMNLHLPQTLEAQAEAAELMEVRHNIVTPRSGEPLIAANQDFISAGYLLTQRNVLFNKDEFAQIVASLSDSCERIEMPLPAVLKPVPLWTGKQITTMLLKPNKESAMTPTLELKACCYAGKKPDGTEWGVMCPEDGYVVVRNGEHLAGNLDKKSLGGSKKGIIYTLYNDVSKEATATFMQRMTRMLVRWLANYGLSIGLEDVQASDHVINATSDLVDDAYVESDSFIGQYRAGTLPLQAGCDLLQSLEASLNGLLGRVREKAGEMCMAELPFHNAPRIMADCGSKGGMVNICQMMACLGQQNVSGARIPEGFVNRTLPIYKPGSKDPPAKGFVTSSFMHGLNAAEFFFHTMGGREGLVDTAVKTANTGYMQRKLVKALEDLSVRYDGMVRTSTGGVVQFVYGDDSLNPAYMATDGSPADWKRLLAAAEAEVRREATVAGEPLVGLTSAQVLRMQVELPAHPALKQLSGTPLSKFTEAATDFLASVARRLAKNEATVSAENTAAGASAVLANTNLISRSMLTRVLTRALRKFRSACIEPGEGVGALAASSLGEPATQMTLKTFHFAGVASMNVTLGVPRLLEIMNASKVISTPIIEAPLVSPDSEVAARIVKARLEKTTLGEISVRISEVYAATTAVVTVELDLSTIAKLHMNVNASTVASAIVRERKLKLKSENVRVVSSTTIEVAPPRDGYKLKGSQFTAAREHLDDRSQMFFAMQHLKRELPHVIVAGVPTVVRAVISKGERSNDPAFSLAVEGTGLLQVLGTPGVRAAGTKSNHVVEVQSVLGIEAARVLIMEEMNKTYSNYGIEIDHRHLMLLADVMTYRGEVLSVNRFGISKMKDSVLMLASFEQTNDHLFHAAAHSKVDSVEGVSECIITGQPMGVGTGCFELLQAPSDSALPEGSAPPAQMALPTAAAVSTSPIPEPALTAGGLSSSPLARFMSPPSPVIKAARPLDAAAQAVTFAPAVGLDIGQGAAPESVKEFRPPRPLLQQMAEDSAGLPAPLWQLPTALTRRPSRASSDASSTRGSRKGSVTFSPVPPPRSVSSASSNGSAPPASAQAPLDLKGGSRKRRR